MRVIVRDRLSRVYLMYGILGKVVTSGQGLMATMAPVSVKSAAP